MTATAPCRCPDCGRVWTTPPGALASSLPPHTHPRPRFDDGPRVDCNGTATVLDATCAYEAAWRNRAAECAAKATAIRDGRRPIMGEALRMLRRWDARAKAATREADRVAAVLKGEPGC